MDGKVLWSVLSPIKSKFSGILGNMPFLTYPVKNYTKLINHSLLRWFFNWVIRQMHDPVLWWLFNNSYSTLISPNVNILNVHQQRKGEKMYLIIEIMPSLSGVTRFGMFYTSWRQWHETGVICTTTCTFCIIESGRKLRMYVIKNHLNESEMAKDIVFMSWSFIWFDNEPQN